LLNIEASAATAAGMAAIPPLPDAIVRDPVPMPRSERGWAWWLGGAISLGVLVAVFGQLARVDFAQVRAILPTSPLFWLVFACSYLAGPTCDWLIYHRLWNMPPAGITALLRKLVGNELLFGYVGELYLYTWARRHTEMTSAPFGAIKDVAILSAMAGNAVTFGLLILAYPLLGALHLGLDSRTLIASVAFLLGTSSVILLFRKSLFSLPRRQLFYVAAIHLLRIFLTTSLAALCWHLVLPDVALQWWLLLAALRMLLTRLPFLPNKDIVFAGLAIFLIGRDAEIGALMTMMATLILSTHIALGLLLGIGEALGWERRS